MKIGLVAASLVLIAGGAVGCGNGDKGKDAPDSTSKGDFCGALQSFQDDFSTADPSKDIKAYIKALKDAAKKLQDVGTPDNMPDDAREGFEITIDEINSLPDDATLEDLSSMGDVSDADQKKIDALDEYISKECPDLDNAS